MLCLSCSTRSSLVSIATSAGAAILCVTIFILAGCGGGGSSASGSANGNNPPTVNAPVASNGTVSTAENTAVNGNLTASGTGTLTYQTASSPAHGMLTVNAASGAFSYTPTLGFSGTDSFTFTASNSGGTSKPATESITVTAVSPLPVLTTSMITPAAQAATFCTTGTYPAQWTWNPVETTNPPAPATSGTPKVEQYRNGKLIATYNVLGSNDPAGSCTLTQNASANPEATVGCGPFNRNDPYRQWQDGDVFMVYPAVYSGVQNQPWIGPGYDTYAQYQASTPFIPTNIIIEGVTVDGVRPVIVVGSSGAGNNTLGQSAVYFAQSQGITFENIDVDASGASAGTVGKSGVYINGGDNLTLADMRVHGFETAGVNGLFGTPNNSGTLELDRLELYQNGGPNGPAHNAYINASTSDPGFTVHLVNSWSYDAYYGHLFKSRAQVNDIEGNYFQGGLPQSGYSQAENYDLDIPNGGLLTVKDNVFAKNASGPNSNGAYITFGVEGIPDSRPLSIDIENNTFVAFSKTYDGSHPLFPFFFAGGLTPGSPGFITPNVTVEKNVFVGFCPSGNAELAYRGDLALTEAFTELNQDFSISNKYISADTSILGVPAYQHAVQGGLVRTVPTIGAEN